MDASRIRQVHSLVALAGRWRVRDGGPLDGLTGAYAAGVPGVAATRIEAGPPPTNSRFHQTGGASGLPR